MKNPMIEEIKAQASAIKILRLEIATKKKLIEREINRLGPREITGMDYSQEKGSTIIESDMDKLIKIMKQKQELEEQEETLKIQEEENNNKKLIILEQLSAPDEKAIFQAVYIDGLSYRSTGRKLNMSKSVIYQKVKKIEEKINNITAKYYMLKTEKLEA